MEETETMFMQRKGKENAKQSKTNCFYQKDGRWEVHWN